MQYQEQCKQLVSPKAHKLSFFIILLLCWLSSCDQLFGNKQQIAKLTYQISGCFSSSKSTLTIYQQDSLTIAKIITDEHPPIEVVLTQNKMVKFNKFILELKELNDECCCTTVEYYTLQRKNELIKRTDGGCDWEGFSHLKKELFGTSH